MSFTTADEWSNAIQAVDDRLQLADQQGYLIFMNPAIRRGLANELATLVIRSAGTGDISDGELPIRIERKGSNNAHVA